MITLSHARDIPDHHLDSNYTITGTEPPVNGLAEEEAADYDGEREVLTSFLCCQTIPLGFHRFPLTASWLPKNPDRRNWFTASVLTAALRTQSQSMPAGLGSVLPQMFSMWGS